jgi:hypothetical protein
VIGRRIIVVAVFDTTIPITTASTKIIASRSRGEPAPTTSTTRSATSCAAPVSTSAVDSGNIAAIRITVVQLIDRNASSTLRSPSTSIAPAASTVATDGATRPEAMATTMSATIASTDSAPVPNGTNWRRTASGRSTISTPRRSWCCWSAAHEPWTSTWSPASSVTSPTRSSPRRCTAMMTRSPDVVTMPG